MSQAQGQAKLLELLAVSYNITFSNLVGGREPPSLDLELTLDLDFLFLLFPLQELESLSERHDKLDKLPPGTI